MHGETRITKRGHICESIAERNKSGEAVEYTILHILNGAKRGRGREGKKGRMCLCLCTRVCMCERACVCMYAGKVTTKSVTNSTTKRVKFQISKP